MKSILLVFLYVCVTKAEVIGPRYCYYKDDNPYFYFSHRTPYNITAEMKPPAIKFPTCTPVYMWSYIRHGTRFPSLDLVLRIKELQKVKDDIIQFHDLDKGGLHLLDLRKLEKWQYNPLQEHRECAGALTIEGAKEMERLCKIFKSSFDKLLNKKKSDDFLISNSNRSKESAIHFVNTLLNTETYNRYEDNDIYRNDKLLRLSKNCPSFENEQKKPSTLRELNLFKLSEEMNKTIRTVSRRLGYSTLLPYETVEAMYACCVSESAANRAKKSPFCAVFRREDMKLFEYKEDLELYWTAGYGNQYTEKLGCPLIRNMMLSIQMIAESNDTKNLIKASFYFGHLEMILALMVKLELSKDTEPPMHNNYEKMKEDRKWRLSYNATFATNFNAVLLSCTSTKLEKFQVVFYQNGREIIIPKCGKSPCPWSELKSHLEMVFDKNQCNTNFCHEQSK